MIKPEIIHEGQGRISFRLLIIGARYLSDEDFRKYCDLTLDNLWNVTPFGLAKDKLDVWIYCGAANYFLPTVDGTIGGLENEVVTESLKQFNEDDPKFPTLETWFRSGIQSGIVVSDFLSPGYRDHVTNGSSAAVSRVSSSLCRLIPEYVNNFGIYSSPVLRHAVMAALPLGGTQVEDPRHQKYYAVVAVQLAKAIGLLLGLGDELEGTAGSEFAGTNSQLPINLSSPHLYNNENPSLSPGDLTPINPSFYTYWRARGYRRGNEVLHLTDASAQIPDAKRIVLVHAEFDLVAHTPMETDLATIQGITEGVHLVEGGGGYDRGIYRAQPNCVMRFPWRYVSEGSSAVRDFSTGSFCPVCKGHIQRVLTGYSNFSLGQIILDPSDFGPDSDHDTGAEFADFIMEEGGDQTSLPQFATANSQLAVLSRISHFFDTQLSISRAESRNYAIDGNFYQYVPELSGSDIGVSLPMLRFAEDEGLADALWVKDYWDPIFENYSDELQSAACLNIAAGIPGAIEHFGLGTLINSSTDPERYRKTLTVEEMDHLRPGSVLEIWKDEDTARSAVCDASAVTPEADNRTLILLSKSEDGFVFADHASNAIQTDSVLTELLQTHDYILAANWYAHGKGRPAYTPQELRNAAENAAAEKKKEHAFDRLDRALAAEQAAVENLWGDGSNPLTLTEYNSSGLRVDDLNLVIGGIKDKALVTAGAGIPLMRKLISEVNELYLRGEASYEMLDDLAMGLNMLLPWWGQQSLVNPWMSTLAEHANIEPILAYQSFPTETPFVGYHAPPPEPPDPMSRSYVHAEYVDLILQDRDHFYDSSDSLKKNVWRYVADRHPVLHLLELENPSIGWEAIESQEHHSLRSIITLPLDDRRPSLCCFVKQRRDELKSAVDALEVLIQAATESRFVGISEHETAGDAWTALSPTFLPALQDTPQFAYNGVTPSKYKCLHKAIMWQYFEAIAPGRNLTILADALAPVLLSAAMFSLFGPVVARFVQGWSTVVEASVAVEAATTSGVTVWATMDAVVTAADVVIALGTLSNKSNLSDIERIKVVNEYLSDVGIRNHTNIINWSRGTRWTEATILAGASIAGYFTLKSLRRSMSGVSIVPALLDELAPLRKFLESFASNTKAGNALEWLIERFQLLPGTLNANKLKNNFPVFDRYVIDVISGVLSDLISVAHGKIPHLVDKYNRMLGGVSESGLAFINIRKALENTEYYDGFVDVAEIANLSDELALEYFTQLVQDSAKLAIPEHLISEFRLFKIQEFSNSKLEWLLEWEQRFIADNGLNGLFDSDPAALADLIIDEKIIGVPMNHSISDDVADEIRTLAEAGQRP